MAEPRDERVSAAYRELPGDGPPPSLDAAIQAAARRAVGSRPAPFRRWQKPLSIAAVLMLAVAVTLQVERKKPVVSDDAPASASSAEYPVPQAAQEPEVPAGKPAEPARRAPSPQPAPEMKRRDAEPPAPASPPSTRAQPAPAMQLAAPAAPPPAAVTAPPAAPAPAPAAAGAPVAAEAFRAEPRAAPRAKSELSREATLQEKRMADALETPERRLERIADLRAKGLHDEADRELAAFRRELPDYRLSEHWLRRVERR
jgi:hypothetical protein